MQPILTVFTPTYNRAHTLVRTYESLCAQTYKGFIWLIIDDGSVDNTKEIVDQWIVERRIQIDYVYKINGGMHTAHNIAYEKILTELNVCIDSDDYMPHDAVEKIVKFWENYGGDEYAGMIGLDADTTGEIIGTPLPEQVVASSFIDLEVKFRCKGDKKLVYRTDIIKSVPEYPVYQNERLVGLSYKYYAVDAIKPLLIMNEVLCNVDYQPDGSSAKIFRQYLESPRGFMEMRKQTMRCVPYFSLRFRSAIHYVSHSITLRNRRFISESPAKFLTVLATPLGLFLYAYVIYRNGGFAKSSRIIRKYH